MKTAFFCIFKCCCCGNAVGKYVPTIHKYTRSNQSGNRPAAMPVKESKARCVCVCVRVFAVAFLRMCLLGTGTETSSIPKASQLLPQLCLM